MIKTKRCKLNNMGLSLVELLVALSVLMIVLTTLTSLIFFVLRSSGRTNANVLIQNESQTVSNLVVDNILDSPGLIMEDYTPKTEGDPDKTEMEAILLGTLTVDWSGATPTAGFVGDAIIWNPSWDESDDAKMERKMYLLTYPESAPLAIDDWSDISDTVVPKASMGSHDHEEAKAAKKALETVKTSFLCVGESGALSADARRLNLMGEYVEDFAVSASSTDVFPSPDTKVQDPSDPLLGDGSPRLVTRYYYAEPFTIDLDLLMYYDYGGNSPLTRKVRDAAALRNRASAIFYDDGSGMKKYYLETE